MHHQHNKLQNLDFSYFNIFLSAKITHKSYNVLTWYFRILSMCSSNSVTISLFTDSLLEEVLFTSPFVLSITSDILGVGGVLFSGRISEFPSWEDIDRTWLPTPELDSVLKRYSPFFFKLEVSGTLGGFFLGGGYLGAVLVTATKVSGTSTAISRCLGAWGRGAIELVELLLGWWLLLLLVEMIDRVFGSLMTSFSAEFSIAVDGGDVGDVTIVFLISQTETEIRFEWDHRYMNYMWSVRH